MPPSLHLHISYTLTNLSIGMFSTVPPTYTISNKERKACSMQGCSTLNEDD